MSLVQRLTKGDCSRIPPCSTCGGMHGNFSVRFYATDPKKEPRIGHCVNSWCTEAYPRKQGASPCSSYVVSGVCKAITEFGRCNFDHPPGDKKKQQTDNSRCKVCTLKLPCRAHFPRFGELLAEEDRQIMAPIEEEDAPLPKYEIVAVIPPRCTVEEAIYAYVLEDNLNYNTTQVVYSAKGYERSPSIERVKVFRLRKFLFHYDKK